MWVRSHHTCVNLVGTLERFQRNREFLGLDKNKIKHRQECEIPLAKGGLPWAPPWALVEGGLGAWEKIKNNTATKASYVLRSRVDPWKCRKWVQFALRVSSFLFPGFLPLRGTPTTTALLSSPTSKMLVWTIYSFIANWKLGALPLFLGMVFTLQPFLFEKGIQWPYNLSSIQEYF